MRGPYRVDPGDLGKTALLIEAVGPDSIGKKIMQDKIKIYPLYLAEVKSPAANILKQQMLSLGGDAAVGRGTVNSTTETTDVLLMGTIKQYKALCPVLALQPWGLQKLKSRLERFLVELQREKSISLKLNRKTLEIGKRTLIMGILNITPDSFSDGGRFLEPLQALKHAKQMVADGADMIDVGAESTRPGAKAVAAEEEINRIIPVLELLRAEIGVPISVDTYHASTARAALETGAEIINDVGGARLDPEMPRVAAEYGCPVVVMHNKKLDVDLPPYRMLAELIDDLEQSIRKYTEAGSAPENIIVDPGLGFGKTPGMNIFILNNLLSLQSLHKPVLLGASRKSFIGAALDLPVTERTEGSMAAAAWGVFNETDILRVHDVRETARLVRVLETIKSARG